MQVQTDFIKRQIDKLVQLVAAAVGARLPQHQMEEVEEEVATAYNRLLNMDRQLFELLAPQLIAQQLGDPKRVQMLARVMHADAELRASQGGHAAAARLCRRALAMLDAQALSAPEERIALESRLAELDGE